MSSEFWNGLVTVGEVVYPPGGTFGPRYQATFQLVLMHTGHVTVWIDGQKHYAEAQTIFLLFPDHEEYFAFAEECETSHTWLHLSTAQIDQPLVERLRHMPWSLPLSPTLNQIMRELLLLQHDPFSTSHELLLTLGMHMLWRYVGEGEAQLTLATQNVSSVVEQARQFIHEHLPERITLETLAQACAVSPAHLIRLFRVQVQMTPMAYLWRQRVRRGIEMLEQTGMSVGTIAYRCGFQSRFHFSRRVREAVGYAPLEIRQRSWQRASLPGALTQAPGAFNPPGEREN